MVFPVPTGFTEGVDPDNVATHEENLDITDISAESSPPKGEDDADNDIANCAKEEQHRTETSTVCEDHPMRHSGESLPSDTYSSDTGSDKRRRRLVWASRVREENRMTRVKTLSAGKEKEHKRTCVAVRSETKK
jgi:hypothetical protein